MTTPIDLDTLHQGILLDPRDDGVRLVYADALEDHAEEGGQHDVARFIRAQMELHAIDAYMDRTGPVPWLGHTHTSRELQSHCPYCNSLKQAEDRIARESSWFWLGRDLQDIVSKCRVEGSPTVWRSNEGPEMAIFQRGFVAEVRCPRDVFLHHAQAIFALHPIQRVMLTDREPWHSIRSIPDPTPLWGWYEHEDLPMATDPDDLPSPLWLCLRDYLEEDGYGWRFHASHELAMQALSRACVNYGRSLNGLPALEYT